jgi:hypothetical protein
VLQQVKTAGRETSNQIKADSFYYTITGVVASDDEFRCMVVRANAGRLQYVQETIKEAWHKVAPDKPYNGFRSPM